MHPHPRLWRRAPGTIVRALAVASLLTLAPAAELVIDLQATNGILRPFHGMNFGPLCTRGMVDLTPRYRELGVPFIRLHDTVWTHADAVDIHTLFPDFRDDPRDPASYDFAVTDDYLAAALQTGAQVIYRLGESIEHTRRQYRVRPPADPARWAAVCVGVVRHYNEGWAGGFQHGLRYWEIWNEPDVRPQMWTGTDEQFLELYEVTARALKDRFPQLRVGGPALGNPGDFVGDTFRPSPLAAQFLARCRERRIPLDFFSWHRYTADAWDLPRRARAVRRMLDDAGFAATESHLNEWNYLPGNDWAPLAPANLGEARRKWFAEIGGPAGAAFVAAALCVLQDAPLDVSTYYGGDNQGFGLFSVDGEPRANFHAVRLFHALLQSRLRCSVQGAIAGQLAACAGIDPDRREVRVLVSNVGLPGAALRIRLSNLPGPGNAHYSAERIGAGPGEARREGAWPADGLELGDWLPAPSVVLIHVRPAG